MRAILFLTTAALALTACGKSKPADEQGPPKRQAGNWKTEIAIKEFDMPGAPPGMAQMMQGMFSAGGGINECLSKEKAEAEDIAKKMTEQGAMGGDKDCTFAKKELVGNTLTIDATCKDGSGSPLLMKVNGTIYPTKMTMMLDMTGKAPTGKGDMKMKMGISAKRTGDCKPGQPEISGGILDSLGGNGGGLGAPDANAPDMPAPPSKPTTPAPMPVPPKTN